MEKALCKASRYTTEYVDERLTAMRFEMAGHRGAVDFVAAYAPTEVAAADNKRTFWGKLDDLVRRIPARECVFVLIDANAPTGERIDGKDKGTWANTGETS